MAFDFPTAPAVDDPYTDPVSGASYNYDGEKWVSSGGGGGGGTTPPAGGVPEAPIDTKQYGRQDAAWTEIAASAAGDFLPLTGGTMTGDLNISGAKIIQGGMQFHLEGALYTAMAEAVAGVFVGVYQIDPYTQVVDFFRPPTLGGTPIVLKTEHDALKTEHKVALNAALAKITALERRIAALEKRRV